MRTRATLPAMAQAPRSELQVWIKRERHRARPGFPKGWSVEDVSERMFALGYTEAKPGTIQIWEAPKGRDPGAENIEGLERVFESKAPGQNEIGPSTMGEAGLTQAISALTLELGKWRQERELLEARVRGLEGVVRLLGERTGVELPELDAPPVGAGSGR